jgi:RimJ/RimL family protein N-acetyltransferase
MQVLQTERLILRPHREDEIDTLYRILVDEIEGPAFTFTAYQPELLFDTSLAQQSLGQHFGRPAIFLRASDRYIGYCLLMPRLCTPYERSCFTQHAASAGLNSIEAEVGWAISNRYRNQGYATEAARALCDYGLHMLQLPRIVAFTERDNLASQRVMHKIGMQMGADAATGAVVGVLSSAAQPQG